MRSDRDPEKRQRSACTGENQKHVGNPGSGRISVAGLGPGHQDHLTPAALQSIADSQVVVGYKAYIELLAPALLKGKEVLSTGMMGEVQRVGMAVDQAVNGNNVVVVSSGDAGIYAMAGLVFEMLETRNLLDSIPVDVFPGIPAFVAAAALLGAPLMHDFASISLSDLLTPWELIEKRLHAAAEADFVISLYNPRSKKRSEHLPKSLEIISTYRAPTTPVGIVNRAMRDGQTVTLTRLEEVNVELVDMQTVLVIGNSSTRITAGRMFTPRGYDGKYTLG